MSSAACPIPWCDALAAAFVQGNRHHGQHDAEGRRSDALAPTGRGKNESQARRLVCRQRRLAPAGGGRGPHRRIPLRACCRNCRTGRCARRSSRSGTRSAIYAGALGIGYNSQVARDEATAGAAVLGRSCAPEYRDEVQIANPISSRTGIRDDRDVRAGLRRRQGVRVAERHSSERQELSAHRRRAQFARRRGAKRRIGVTLLHDGATEIANGFPIRLVVPCEGTGYEVGSMSIVRGAPHLANARRFYDWALSPAAQQIAGDTKNFQMPSNKATRDSRRDAGFRRDEADPIRLRPVCECDRTPAAAGEMGSRSQCAAAMSPRPASRIFANAVWPFCGRAPREDVE